MEDTWSAAELRRHLSRRKDEHERKHRGGDSTERRHRDPDWESTDRHGDRKEDRERRRERDRQERHGQDPREDRDKRKDQMRHDKDRLREGDDEEDRRRRREDKERRRKERDRERRTERDRGTHEEREHRDKDLERRREDKERRREERERERRTDRDTGTHEEREHRDKDLERRREDKERRREERERERRTDRDTGTHEEREHRDKDLERRREDKERRREERDRERRTERDRGTHEQREHRDGEKDLERRREDRDRRVRQEDRKHSRAEREQHRQHKEDRETRHKDRRHHDERRRRDTEEGAEAVRHRRGDEDHAERKRRTERRHGEDPERHPREGHQDKQSHSQESRSGKKAEEYVMHSGDAAAKEAGDAEQPVANDESLQQYEDDFEDYEEDFEELDENEKDGKEEEEEVKAIQRAMGEENQRVRASLSTLSREEEEEKMPEVKGSAQKPSRSSQRGKFMDFVAARQREVIKKVSSKQKKRSAELLRLIDLDLSTTLSLLDLPPVSEYDMYIRNFGAANTKQAYVQCNEDNVDRDVQTEEIDMSDKWTQHPAEHCGACGGRNKRMIQTSSKDGHLGRWKLCLHFASDLTDSYGSHDTRDMSGMNLDSRRLAAFLRSASQVMVVLLEEDHAQKTSFKGRSTQTDTLSFSDGSVQLNTKLPFLDGRTISVLQFSPVQRHTLLSVHQPASSPGAVVQLDHCSVICIWRIWEPSRPQKILLVESEVTCCCFSPGKSTLVFAGTSIGSVVLWDLREPDGDHERLKVSEDEWTFRRPTFSTDALSAAHFSSVTSVEVVPASVPGRPGSEVPFLASEEELLGLSFQLASLDESGLLNLWVVLQLPQANEAGSQTDLGLRPGGKVKLLHSSSCVMSEGVWPWLADKSVPLQTLALKFLPTDCSHFFIGTSMGLVRHGTTQGLKAPPKFYSSKEFGARLVDVSAIHFSPFRPRLFLVGCGDGSVRLHQVSCDKPVAEWTDSTAGEAVVSLQWSQTRPAVFCVLDAASNLHVWDLLKKDSGPLVTERMDRLTAMAAFGDPGQQNAYSGIATSQQSGKIEMHYFTHDFSLPSHEEEETLEIISQAP
ncbi:cytoplasmic dynein 2 intermediate chain 1 isoform X2 [Dunckerocampus dactyliophorus]|nr:cytoplasmic dynein 2 intermediate chain 1 isoform X2 [Dunckerocampus dactyliophorus]